MSLSSQVQDDAAVAAPLGPRGGAGPGWAPSCRATALDLAFLVGVLVLLQAPLLFSPSFVPRHDTFGTLTVFHSTYGNLVQAGELPLWAPYVNYGMPIGYYQLTAVTPAGYVALLGGWLLGVDDALLVFKWAVFGDFLIYLLGLYTLGRSLFQERASVFFVCLAGIAFPVWFGQIFMTLRIFYLLPWILYFLTQYLCRQRPEAFWLTGACTLVALIGNAGYYASLYLLTLTCFSLPLVIARPRLLTAWATPTWRNAAALALFVALAVPYFLMLRHYLEGLRCVSPGRDPVTGTNTLEEFLTHAAFEKSLPPFIATLGWPLMMELSPYVGLLPWALFVLAVVRRRTPLLAGILLTVAVLCGLTFSETIGAILYYFPLMKYFRHVTYVVALVPLFVLLGAGLGLDVLLQSPPRSQWNFAALALVGCGLVGVVLFWSPPQSINHWSLVKTSFADIPGYMFFWLRLAVYLGLLLGGVLYLQRHEADSRVVAGLVLAGLVFDLGSHQVLAYPAVPRLTPELRAQLSQTGLPYVPTRQNDVPAVTPQAYSTIYSFHYQFEHKDPYDIKARVELLSAGVLDFLEARGHPLTPRPDGHFAHPAMPLGEDDAPLQRAFGYQAPKLRLVRRVALADGRDAAARQLTHAAAPDEAPVLNGPPPAPSSPRGGSEADAIEVEQFQANELVARVDVAGTEPAWLYYADSFHPEWRATVNGEDVPVYAANLAFKAIPVPPGQNVVRLRFGAPATVAAAYVVAAVGVLFCAAALGISLFQRPTPLPADSGA